MRYALLVVLLTGVGFVGWALGRYVTDQPITDPTIHEPRPTVSATPEVIPTPNRDPILGGTGESRIIERTETVRDDDSDDSDDEAPAPRVTVIVPRPTSAPTTPAPTTRAPVVPDLTEVIPDISDVIPPDLGLPLLP